MTGGLFEEEAPDRASVFEAPDDAPLAERMRPRSAEEFLGQHHLVQGGGVLERALAG